MIVEKITEGYVVQRFGTKTGLLIDQEFVAGDGTYFENPETKMPVNDTKITDSLYHHFKMVQAIYFEIGDEVVVDSTKADNGLIEHDFIGTLEEISQRKDSTVGSVRDQEDNLFTVNLKSLEPTKYGD